MDYRDGATMHTHAYFRNEDEARKALATLDAIVGGAGDEPGDELVTVATFAPDEPEGDGQ